MPQPSQPHTVRRPMPGQMMQSLPMQQPGRMQANKKKRRYIDKLIAPKVRNYNNRHMNFEVNLFRFVNSFLNLRRTWICWPMNRSWMLQFQERN